MPSIQDIKEKTSKYRGNLHEELRIEDAIEYAEVIAKDMHIVKTHQIRRFFSAIKNIQKKVINVKDDVAFPSEEYAELQMLRPQLANAVGRLHGQEEKAMKNLLEILQPVFKTVKTNKDFARFVNFFESIVAYHKVYAKQ